MIDAAVVTPSMFAVFRKRDFRLIWLAQLISTAGSALTDLAAGIYVYRVTGSALAVGLTLIVTAIPTLVVGLLAGVFVDRHDRRLIMMWTCLIQSVIVALIAVVIGIDAIALPGLYVLLLLNAGVKQFFDPAYESLIPEMADDDELAAANSFLIIAAFGSTAVGFAAAGLLASTVDLHWAFLIDAASFLVCAGLISLMGRYPMPKPEDEASPSVIIGNLRAGLTTLLGTPMIRSLVLIGGLASFSIGIWNVLLLPFSISELGASEFVYGLQEGLTSVGFVLGSFAMARYSKRLPEPLWLIVGLAGMGIASVAYGFATGIPFAIVMVMISGFFNAPTYVSRSVLMQRNTPREMRGRVFSAAFVIRDITFLLGMGAAGLADVVDIRILLVASGSLLLLAAGYTVFAPGLNHRDWGAAQDRLAEAAEAPRLAAVGGRAATASDFDLLATHVGTLTRLSPEQRDAFVRDATIRELPEGTSVMQHGDPATSAYFVLAGSTTAGIPEENGYRGLSTMGPGDFFGEIGALTGSPRTADVVTDTDCTLMEIPADALRGAMVVPEVAHLLLGTMSTRLQRTPSADLPRLASVDQQSLRELRIAPPAAEPGATGGNGDPAD